MKLILLSDCHMCVDKPVGRLDNNMLSVGLSKLEYVFQYAQENNIYHILQGGDFLDVRRSWELVSELSRFLKYWQKRDILLYGVAGQHDMYFHSTTNEKTALGVLISAGLFTRLTMQAQSFSDNKTSINLYGSSFGEAIPTGELSGVNILVCHRQILMKKEWAQQEHYEYAPEFLRNNEGYDLILCGDMHQKFDFKDGKRYICNAGVMMRLEATESNMSHMPGFYIYDTDKLTLKYELIKIAKNGSEVLSKEHLKQQKLRRQNFEDFVSNIKNSEDDTKSPDFDKNLQTLMDRSKTSPNVREHISEYLARGGSNG